MPQFFGGSSVVAIPSVYIYIYKLWSFQLFQVYMARSLKVLKFQEILIVIAEVKKMKEKIF
jgi:hypothetical protein